MFDSLFWSYWLSAAGMIWVYMTGLFLLSILRKRNDIADVAWGLGFVLVAWSTYHRLQNLSAGAWLVLLLVSVWGLRLAGHIYLRNRHKTEDYRYAAWREAWGKWFWLRSYAQVYLLQGFLLLLVSIPVIQSLVGYATLSWPLLIGAMIWGIGFYFEVVGDYQLSQFIKNPNNKGKILQSGLWARTRHPNYFGEVTQWWGIYCMALSTAEAGWTIIGPLVITILILKVSGIPLLEEKYKNDPAFAVYKKRVPVFFPLLSVKK